MTTRFRFGFLALTWFVTSSDDFAGQTAARPEHTNRLGQEKSPYLLQHAHNPVDWYAWGEEALSKARRENKPIFLSRLFDVPLVPRHGARIIREWRSGRHHES
jgi:uncharacterized protein DUF255